MLDTANRIRLLYDWEYYYMISNEELTRLLAVSSLVVSLFTLYQTYFNKSASIVGMLVSDSVNKGKFDGTLEYSVSNTGKVQLVLKEVEILVGKTNKRPGFHILEKSKATNVPCVIEPGHIKLINVEYNIKSVDKARIEKNGTFVCITFFSSQGKAYEVMHEITYIRDLDAKDRDNAWLPFRLGKPI